MQTITLGTPVKDKITGFSGTTTGYCTYITGCDQYLVQPSTKPDGSFVDAKWYDVARLEVTGQPTITMESLNAGVDPASTGSDIAAPTK